MKLYNFAKAVTHILVRVLFRMRYDGLEHIPDGGGYILACNHRTNFDPLFITHKIVPQISYLAKVELTRSLLKPVFKGLGVIPIDRGKGDTGALDEAMRHIREGGILGIFPEGHRSRDGLPLRPRSGVSLIAGKAGADVLPCAVVYGKKLGFRTTVTVRYGPMIANRTLGVDPSSPSTVRAASRLIMDKILALISDKAPEGEG